MLKELELAKKYEIYLKYTQIEPGSGSGFSDATRAGLRGSKNRVLSKYPVSGLPGPENPVPSPARVRTLIIIFKLFEI